MNAVINTADEQGTGDRAKPLTTNPEKSASGSPPYTSLEEETASLEDTETPSKEREQTGNDPQITTSETPAID